MDECTSDDEIFCGPVTDAELRARAKRGINDNDKTLDFSFNMNYISEDEEVENESSVCEGLKELSNKKQPFHRLDSISEGLDSSHVSSNNSFQDSLENLKGYASPILLNRHGKHVKSTMMTKDTSFSADSLEYESSKSQDSGMLCNITNDSLTHANLKESLIYPSEGCSVKSHERSNIHCDLMWVQTKVDEPEQMKKDDFEQITNDKSVERKDNFNLQQNGLSFTVQKVTSLIKDTSHCQESESMSKSELFRCSLFEEKTLQNADDVDSVAPFSSDTSLSDESMDKISSYSTSTTILVDEKTFAQQEQSDTSELLSVSKLSFLHDNQEAVILQNSLENNMENSCNFEEGNAMSLESDVSVVNDILTIRPDNVQFPEKATVLEEQVRSVKQLGDELILEGDEQMNTSEIYMDILSDQLTDHDTSSQELAGANNNLKDSGFHDVSLSCAASSVKQSPSATCNVMEYINYSENSVTYTSTKESCSLEISSLLDASEMTFNVTNLSVFDMPAICTETSGQEIDAKKLDPSQNTQVELENENNSSKSNICLKNEYGNLAVDEQETVGQTENFSLHESSFRNDDSSSKNFSHNTAEEHDRDVYKNESVDEVVEKEVEEHDVYMNKTIDEVVGKEVEAHDVCKNETVDKEVKAHDVCKNETVDEVVDKAEEHDVYMNNTVDEVVGKEVEAHDVGKNETVDEVVDNEVKAHDVCMDETVDEVVDKEMEEHDVYMNETVDEVVDKEVEEHGSISVNGRSQIVIEFNQSSENMSPKKSLNNETESEIYSSNTGFDSEDESNQLPQQMAENCAMVQIESHDMTAIESNIIAVEHIDTNDEIKAEKGSNFILVNESNCSITEECVGDKNENNVGDETVDEVGKEMEEHYVYMNETVDEVVDKIVDKHVYMNETVDTEMEEHGSISVDDRSQTAIEFSQSSENNMSPKKSLNDETELEINSSNTGFGSEDESNQLPQQIAENCVMVQMESHDMTVVESHIIAVQHVDTNDEIRVQNRSNSFILGNESNCSITDECDVGDENVFAEDSVVYYEADLSQVAKDKVNANEQDNQMIHAEVNSTIVKQEICNENKVDIDSTQEFQASDENLKLDDSAVNLEATNEINVSQQLNLVRDNATSNAYKDISESLKEFENNEKNCLLEDLYQKSAELEVEENGPTRNNTDIVDQEDKNDDKSNFVQERQIYDIDETNMDFVENEKGEIYTPHEITNHQTVSILVDNTCLPISENEDRVEHSEMSINSNVYDELSFRDNNENKNEDMGLTKMIHDFDPKSCLFENSELFSESKIVEDIDNERVVHDDMQHFSYADFTIAKEITMQDGTCFIQEHDFNADNDNELNLSKMSQIDLENDDADSSLINKFDSQVGNEDKFSSKVNANNISQEVISIEQQVCNQSIHSHHETEVVGSTELKELQLSDEKDVEQHFTYADFTIAEEISMQDETCFIQEPDFDADKDSEPNVSKMSQVGLENSVVDSNLISDFDIQVGNEDNKLSSEVNANNISQETIFIDQQLCNQSIHLYHEAEVIKESKVVEDVVRSVEYELQLSDEKEAATEDISCILFSQDSFFEQNKMVVIPVCETFKLDLSHDGDGLNNQCKDLNGNEDDQAPSSPNMLSIKSDDTANVGDSVNLLVFDHFVINESLVENAPEESLTASFLERFESNLKIWDQSISVSNTEHQVKESLLIEKRSSANFIDSFTLSQPDNLERPETFDISGSQEISSTYILNEKTSSFMDIEAFNEISSIDGLKMQDKSSKLIDLSCMSNTCTVDEFSFDEETRLQQLKELNVDDSENLSFVSNSSEHSSKENSMSKNEKFDLTIQVTKDNEDMARDILDKENLILDKEGLKESLPNKERFSANFIDNFTSLEPDNVKPSETLDISGSQEILSTHLINYTSSEKPSKDTEVLKDLSIGKIDGLKIQDKSSKSVDLSCMSNTCTLDEFSFNEENRLLKLKELNTDDSENSSFVSNSPEHPSKENSVTNNERFDVDQAAKDNEDIARDILDKGISLIESHTHHQATTDCLLETSIVGGTDYPVNGDNSTVELATNKNYPLVSFESTCITDNCLVPQVCLTPLYVDTEEFRDYLKAADNLSQCEVKFNTPFTSECSPSLNFKPCDKLLNNLLLHTPNKSNPNFSLSSLFNSDSKLHEQSFNIVEMTQLLNNTCNTSRIEDEVLFNDEQCTSKDIMKLPVTDNDLGISLLPLSDVFETEVRSAHKGSHVTMRPSSLKRLSSTKRTVKVINADGMISAILNSGCKLHPLTVPAEEPVFTGDVKKQLFTNDEDFIEGEELDLNEDLDVILARMSSSPIKKCTNLELQDSAQGSQKKTPIKRSQVKKETACTPSVSFKKPTCSVKPSIPFGPSKENIPAKKNVPCFGISKTPNAKPKKTSEFLTQSLNPPRFCKRQTDATISSKNIAGSLKKPIPSLQVSSMPAKKTPVKSDSTNVKSTITPSKIIPKAGLLQISTLVSATKNRFGFRPDKTMDVASSLPKKTAKVMTPKKYLNVQSPVGKYIQETPITPLIQNVKPDRRAFTIPKAAVQMKVPSQEAWKSTKLETPVLPPAKYTKKIGNNKLIVKTTPMKSKPILKAQNIPTPVVTKHIGTSKVIKGYNYLVNEESLLDASHEPKVLLPPMKTQPDMDVTLVHEVDIIRSNTLTKSSKKIK